MVAAKSYLKDAVTENQPQRTLLLFGLSPVHRVTGGRHPSGAVIHCDPDRLLLPLITEDFTTSDDLSLYETASAAKNLN